MSKKANSVTSPKKIVGKDYKEIIQFEKEECSKLLTHAMSYWDKPNINPHDPKEIEERIKGYFNDCLINDIKPTVEGMSMALGMSVKSIRDYVNGVTGTPEIQEIMQKAYSILNNLLVNYMQGNHSNVVGSIFLLKNNFGYRDQSEVIIDKTSKIEHVKSNEELRQKYLESMGDVIDIEPNIKEEPKQLEGNVRQPKIKKAKEKVLVES